MPKKRKVGRPATGRTPMAHLHIGIDPKLKARIEEAAAKDGRKLNAFVSMVMLKHLNAN